MQKSIAALRAAQQDPNSVIVTSVVGLDARGPIEVPADDLIAYWQARLNGKPERLEDFLSGHSHRQPSTPPGLHLYEDTESNYFALGIINGSFQRGSGGNAGGSTITEIGPGYDAADLLVASGYVSVDGYNDWSHQICGSRVGLNASGQNAKFVSDEAVAWVNDLDCDLESGSVHGDHYGTWHSNNFSLPGHEIYMY
jgi:hypothetical protein